MNSSHVVARCSWQSAFDQQARAHDLQNFISRWSNEVLTEELERCFNELCPATQTWRIDALHLDVGDIPLEDLPDELPRRLRESLRTALDRMLMNQHFSQSGKDGEHLQILEATELLQEFVIWFLHNGTVPWWFKGSESAMQILDEQLETHPLSTADIIRDLGRSDIVRKRIVRQCGEHRVCKIIHLLEPWQGDFICSFADNLFVTQVKRQIPRTGPSEYMEHTWLNILTYLLVDRGSLFNTTAFVRANLWQTAQHYQIDYHELLEQMFQAVHALEPLGLVTHAFLSSIKAIYAQDHGNINTVQREDEQTPDPWSTLQKMLRYGRDRHTIGPDSVRVDELFTSLAQSDAARMAMLLRAEGKSASVRQGILQHFAFDELALLVQVLQPQDQPFIVAYVRQAQAQAELQHWDKKNVWQVVLVYLLAERGSHFNRRQLVYETLQGLSRLHKVELVPLLDILIQALHENYANSRYFELLDIFQDLRGEQERRQVLAKPQSRYWNAALHYLGTGKHGFASGVPGMGTPQLGFEHLKSFAGEESLAALLQAPGLRSTNDALLSQRLLRLAGAADLPLLFDLVEPGSAGFCVALLSQLTLWRKQSLLPSLDKVDLAFHLPAIMIQALPGFRNKQAGSKSGFDSSAFWQALTRLLQQKYGVDIRSFQQQLRQCLDQDGLAAGAGLSLLSSLIGGKTVYTSQPALKPALWQGRRGTGRVQFMDSAGPLSPDWSPAQLLHALRLRLAAPAAQSKQDVPQALMTLPTAELLHLVAALDGVTVRDWLQGQPDKSYLLARLSRGHHIHAIQQGLVAHLPTELGSPDETLKQLSLLFRQSGNWHGTTAVLEQQLQEVLWAVMLNAGAITLSASEWLAAFMTNACLRLDMALSGCLESFKHQPHLLQKTYWRDAHGLISKRAMRTAEEDRQATLPAPKAAQPAGNHLHAEVSAGFRQDHLARYLDHPRLTSIARHLLQHGRPPAWLGDGQTIDMGRLLFDVFTFRPDLLSAMLHGWQSRPEVMIRLLNTVPFSWLLDAMRASAADRQAITMLAQFQQLLEQVTVPGSSKQQRNAILFQLVLKHWLKKDWAALEPDKLIAEFLWQLVRSRQLSQAALQKVFEPHLVKQPGTIRLALEKAMGMDYGSKNMPGREPSALISQTEKKLAAAIKATQEPRHHTVPTHVLNCGLVLLQSFIPTLFSRLRLVENHQFVTHCAQRRAVHFLQFLVTGCCETAEEHLVLNKLLCGLALHEPVDIGIEISAEEEGVCQSLLNAVIGYWDAIGDSSIEGLRGNWLVRKGSLSHAGDHWDLIVEKRVYDLLLARSPFSYSVIKFPWMEKAIYVTWPT